jgi:hypothetical protein
VHQTLGTIFGNVSPTLLGVLNTPLLHRRY